MIIKVKNYDSFMYCAKTDLICLNQNIMVDAKKVMLDDSLMQSYIIAKKSFAIIYSKKFGNTANLEAILPNFETIIDKSVSHDDYEIILTDLISVKTVNNKQGSDYRILFRKQDTGFTYISNVFAKLFIELTTNLPDVKFYQNGYLSQIQIYANGDFMGLIMPVQIKDCEISNMYADRIKHDVKKNYIKFVD